MHGYRLQGPGLPMLMSFTEHYVPNLPNTNLKNGSLFINGGDESRQGVVAHEAIHTNSK